MKKKYPGVEEAEKQRCVTSVEIEEEPDWEAGTPNYEKWPSKSPEHDFIVCGQILMNLFNLLTNNQ